MFIVADLDSLNDNLLINWARRETTVANNKGADQPAHPRSLISAFAIGLL